MNTCSLVDTSTNDYLALFLKGDTDGEPRDDRILNAVIALDISGSMGGALSFKQKSKENRNRLDLCKEAIKMFVSKMRPTDSFGLIIFNNEGKVIVPCEKISTFNLQNLFDKVNSIQINGGTTIKNGIVTAVQCLKEGSITGEACENRIIVLTDVNDGSLSNEKPYLQELANQQIHTTIIGVSESFQSQICEVFKNIKGFNYLSATENEDLKKHLFQNFDFTFFPATYDVNVILESKSILGIEVFGTPDSDHVLEYNVNSKPTQFIVTKIGTSFPSDISIKGDQMHTFGGLILIKLKNAGNLQEFHATVTIQYKDLQMKENQKQYHISYNIPGQEQFYSSQSVQEAMDAYQYVSQMKRLIHEANEHSKNLNQELKERWMDSLTMLKKICPKSKLEQVEKVQKIIINKFKQE